MKSSGTTCAFPDAPKSILDRAVFPHANGVAKPDAVRGFLAYTLSELRPMGAAVTADVFGVTTAGGDVGIGQVWKRFIDVVDVALPMVYPSHYWTGSYGEQFPNARPYEIITASIQDAIDESAELVAETDLERVGSIRPWLQDFTLGEPAYGAPEVRAQIQALYDLGIQEWILWNPSSRYTEEALAPAEENTEWTEFGIPIRIADQIVPAGLRKVVGEYDALEAKLSERPFRILGGVDDLSRVTDGEGG